MSEPTEKNTESNPEQQTFKSRGFIGLFARHKLAPNLLMIIIFLAGIVALMKLNVQFFPTFTLDYASVFVDWPAANAEDVERSITNPIERVLRNLDNLDEMTSTSYLGRAVIVLKFKEHTNMIEALDQINQRVGELRNLPQDSKSPVIERIVHYESIARVLLVGKTASIEEMRPLVRRFEKQLLGAGIDKITLKGMPVEEMAIEISAKQLAQHGLTIEQVAAKISEVSRDFPVGSVGESDSIRDIRAMQQARSEADFNNLVIIATDTQKLKLGQIATIERRAVQNSPQLFVDGYPAIEMQLQRSGAGDTIESSNIMQTWLAATEPILPESMELQVYDESWSLVAERIGLLVSVGASGLILVVLILYIFMHGRVAFWVAVGIPISFMATLIILYLTGGSINMISLFALIMALGIIVDDAIVVGEDVLSHYEAGEPALQAAEGGAYRMLAPVTASSITTIAAFLPLMLIGGEIGSILFAIPLVIIAVVFASLLESFVILPGHLRHALHKVKPSEKGSIRYRLDLTINHWRNHQFRAVIRWVLNNRSITLASALAAMVLVMALFAGGRVGFVFFPSPESMSIQADASFVAGTSPEVTRDYISRLYQALRATEQELEPGIVTTAVVRYFAHSRQMGATFGGINIELVESDKRETRNEAFIKLWREKAGVVPGLDTLIIGSPTAGPPGSDIDIRLSGIEPRQLKAASLELQDVLHQISGVSGVRDDLPFGRNQLIYQLTPQGKALGFTYVSLGRQLSDVFAGRLVQVFADGEDEVEVRVQFPREAQARLSTLNQLQVVSPTGLRVPLSSVVSWQAQRGFDVVRHVDGRLAVSVLADVDRSVNNANQILNQLQQTSLADLVDKYGLQYSLEGQRANQAETMSDMATGVLIALAIIYIVLAWVFSSYGWPLVVMMAIPFGLVGAVLGHWWLGIDMTILSLFGFFGLSGIVVNDSIILISFYKRLRQEGMAVNAALEEAAVQRVRAVLLTSLTTIAGLTPLLFETSLQAQFLIPMAASIAFGLAFSTLLILLVIPAMLSIYEGIAEKRKDKLESVTSLRHRTQAIDSSRV